MTLPRRRLLAGLGIALAAPAIIRRPELLMPIRRLKTWNVQWVNAFDPSTLTPVQQVNHVWMNENFPSQPAPVGYILLTNQTDAKDNGIYAVSAHGLIRPT
jgi:hypothetical protein